MKQGIPQFIFLVLVLISGLALTSADITFPLIRWINETFQTNLDIFFRAQGFFAFGYTLVTIALMLMPYSPALHLSKNQIPVFATIILLISHISLLIVSKQNIPIFDEFTGSFDFLCNYNNTSTLHEKIALLLKPYFECRTTVPFLIILLISKLGLSAFPLSFLVATNALILFWIAKIICRSTLKSNLLHFHFPFLLLLLFHCQYMLSSINSFSGLCYNGVILFSLLALNVSDSNSKRANIKAVFFSICAIFTFGNGLIVIPLLFYKTYLKSGLKSAIFLIVPLLVLVAVYFLNYHPYQFHKETFNFVDFLLFIPVFLGSSFQFFYSMMIPLIIGLAIIAIYLYAVLSSYHKKNPSLFLTMSFFIFTAIITSAFRHNIAFETALRLRYGLFSSLSVFCTVFLFIDLLAQQKVQFLLRRISIIAILFNLSCAQFFYPESSLTIIHNKVMIDQLRKGAKENEPSPYYPGGIEPVIRCSIKQGWM